MKKIPTLFVRDADFRATPEVNPECQWVMDGEGRATVKFDGTCCRVLKGELWKRYTLKPGKAVPFGFESAPPLVSGNEKQPGWVPVMDGKEDKYHRATFKAGRNWVEGTYELVGPKVQGNPMGLLVHVLRRHGDTSEPPAALKHRDRIIDPERSFDGLRRHLSEFADEGVVFHHPDGRMAKIKARDFGLLWPMDWTITEIRRGNYRPSPRGRKR